MYQDFSLTFLGVWSHGYKYIHRDVVISPLLTSLSWIVVLIECHLLFLPAFASINNHFAFCLSGVYLVRDLISGITLYLIICDRYISLSVMSSHIFPCAIHVNFFLSFPSLQVGISYHLNNWLLIYLGVINCICLVLIEGSCVNSLIHSWWLVLSWVDLDT